MKAKKRLIFVMTLVIGLFLLVMLLAPIVVPTKSLAHEWYPSECCSGQDCAPATIETVPNTAASSGLSLGPPAAHASEYLLVVTTIHGRVMVPSDFKCRESKDHQWHACIVKRLVDGKMVNRLLCLFCPPTT